MAEGRDLVKEAVQDAKSLREAALQAAKAELIEDMTPALKVLLEKQIKNAMNGNIEEKRGLTGKASSSQRADYISPKLAKWEEGKEPKGDHKMADKHDQELDMEALHSFFPQIAEEPEGLEGDMEEAQVDPHSVTGNRKVPHLSGHGEEQGKPPVAAEFGEMAEAHEDGTECEGEVCPHEDHAADGHPVVKKEAKKKDGEEEVDEEVEISEAELRKVYEAALQTEVNVKKGFSDMSKFVDFEDEKADGTGILPANKSEKFWNEEEPPAVTKNVPENVVRAVRAGIAENKALRAKLIEAAKMIKTLGGKLHEVNLFNAKVLHVNRILNSGRKLTTEQKKVVMEAIDKAETTKQVTLVYEAIVNSFSASEKLAEARVRAPKGNASRVRTSGTPNEKVLSESVDRAQGEEKYSRMQQLAGLKEIK